MGENTDQVKHYLDTSVLRGLLIGGTAYRQHLADQLGSRRYVDRFVDMEFRRGVLLPLIDFYNTLCMPNLASISDAEKLWSNSFKVREVKLVLALSSDIFDRHKLDRSNPRHKERGMMALTGAIKRFDRALRHRFRSPSNDRTHCVRGASPLTGVSLHSVRARRDLNSYADRFRDVAACRAACRVDKFFGHYKGDVNACITRVVELPQLKVHESVREVEAELRAIKNDTNHCSCKSCEKVGDVVISINAPRTMRVETTDTSFTHWCSAIAQPFQIHSNEKAFVSAHASKPSSHRS